MQLLERWIEVAAREFPNRPDLLNMIQTTNSIDIAKLANGRALSPDSCNSAHKSRRILVQLIEKQGGIVHEVYCVQHLHYVRFNAFSNAVFAFITTYLEDSLEEVIRFLCVFPDLAQLIRSYHKWFSLTEN